MLRTRFSFALLFLAALVGTAHADEDTATETAGRWLGGANEGVQAFGKIGNLLVSVTAKSFVGAGTGGDKRDLANSWNAAIQAWKGTADATKKSIPYSVAPAAFIVSDIATSVVAPAMEGDGSGAVSGAVNMGVSSLATAEGAAVGAKIFAVAGGAIGSFFPVVGTAAGTVVGGAIGSVAGGFITSIAYDRYGKSIIGNVINAFTETDSLQQAYDARDEFLRKQAAPELAKNWDYNLSVSASFGEEEQQLQKNLSISRIQVKPQPKPNAAPANEQLTALQNATVIQLSSWGKETSQYKVPMTCRINGAAARCTGTFKIDTADGHSQSSYVLTGTLTNNTISGTSNIVMDAVISNGSPCKSFTYEYSHRETITLAEDGSLTSEISPSTGRLTKNNCSPSLQASPKSPGAKSIGTWRVLN